MDVLAYFAIKFPTWNTTDENLLDRMGSMHKMPLHSTCGRDCMKAIDIGYAFAEVVKEGYGLESFGHYDHVISLIIHTCSVFIDG